jgi:hypothetical protein
MAKGRRISRESFKLRVSNYERIFELFIRNRKLKIFFSPSPLSLILEKKATLNFILIEPHLLLK